MKFVGILLVIITISIAAFVFIQTRKTTIQVRKNTESTQQLTPIPTSNVSHGQPPSMPLTLNNNFTIHIFAQGLTNPRVLQFTPDGTLLVSDLGTNQVIALPDKNHDGVADMNKVVINQGNHIHGLAFYDRQLYVAEVMRVIRYNWEETNLEATLDKVLFTLPFNNNHNNRTLAFDKNGKLYISLGSTCNVCNQPPTEGGSVLISDAQGTKPTVFATGLRNAAFIHLNPTTDEFWGTEMGRDNLGDDIPPDEINIIRAGHNYGWPNCYGTKVQDTQFHPGPNPCSGTEAPIYEIPAHSAPLGFTFINSSQFPADWQGDLLVAYHGSWNRTTAIGYKVVHLKVENNAITHSEDFLSGFLQGTTKDSATGRPVDLTFDQQGNLYLSDDKAGIIYIIQKK